LTTAGAVLTGGRSRRMGVDKAVLEVGGVRLADRVASALAAGGCHPVAFIGGDGSTLAAGGRDWYPDRFPGDGPVGGVLTALDALADDVLVAACDLVDLDGPTVAALLTAATTADADVVVARSDRPEPMLARWRATCRPAIEEAFRDGERAVHRVLARLVMVEVAVDPVRLRNVNTPSDVERPRAKPP
jgi:molybdopterin-guanine dinucleotide biosynthesis protein A